MTALSLRKASDYSLADLADFVTRSFERYFVPILMTEANVLARVRIDSLDLAESRVALADGEIAGAALIARRGWSSRVAAMGIVPEWRNKGVGKYFMQELLRDARQRGDHELVLEVIVQNASAVHLYEQTGFRKVRRLVGLTAEGLDGAAHGGLEQIDIRDLGGLISRFGLPDLPWHLSAETVACQTPPLRAYRLNGAYAMISDPGADEVRFTSLLVEPSVRGRGQARGIIRAILAEHPGRKWHVPPVFPEEIIGPFEAAGFEREELAQWQMATDPRQ